MQIETKITIGPSREMKCNVPIKIILIDSLTCALSLRKLIPITNSNVDLYRVAVRYNNFASRYYNMRNLQNQFFITHSTITKAVKTFEFDNFSYSFQCFISYTHTEKLNGL